VNYAAKYDRKEMSDALTGMNGELLSSLNNRFNLLKTSLNRNSLDHFFLNDADVTGLNARFLKI